MSNYHDNQLDTQVNTEMMRVCKCIIPYLDRDIQKNVAVGLKFLELVNTINIYNSPSIDNSMDNNLNLMRQGNWEDDLLHSVRSNLSPEKAYLIDALLKLKEFRSIIQTKDTPSPLNLSHTEPENQPSFFDNHIDSDPSETPRTPKNNTNSSSPVNFLQLLSPLLDDNQKQILNLVSTFLGPNK